MEAGKELDAIIAKELFRYYIEYPMGSSYVHLLDGAGNYVETKCSSEENAWSHCPDYSTNLADAWLVIEHFAWPKFYTNLTKTDKGNWRCDIETHGGDGPTYSAYHKDVPMAICLAALKVHGVNYGSSS